MAPGQMKVTFCGLGSQTKVHCKIDVFVCVCVCVCVYIYVCACVCMSA